VRAQAQLQLQRACCLLLRQPQQLQTLHQHSRVVVVVCSLYRICACCCMMRSCSHLGTQHQLKWSVHSPTWRTG
jgi:uncharacterized protein YcbK (DUF882 family)